MNAAERTTPPHDKNSLTIRLQHIIQSPVFRVIVRIGRIALYIFGVWTILLYYWSFLGILIGIGLAAVSKEGAWRRHGYVLAYSSGLLTGTMTVYAWLWTLLIFLVLISYLLGSLIVYGARSINTLIHRLLKKQKTPSSIVKKSLVKRIFANRIQINALTSRPKLSLRLKTLATLVVFVAPLLMWSSINIDLGVLFDNSPTLLWIQAPSTVNLDDDFDVTVEAWDSFERLSGSYRGTVNFSIVSYNLTTGLQLSSVDATLPGEYTFTGAFYSAGIVPAYMMLGSQDFGLHSFTTRINTVGIHYILVEDSLTQNTYWSNPIIVDNFAIDSPRIYWGDLHGHSAISDGSGTPTESYYYGRYISRLDFMSLTDHGLDFTMFDRLKTGTAEYWNYMMSTADAYAPNEFVTLYGIEWTTNYVDQVFLFIPVPTAIGGHYTCIFSGETMPILSAITENTASELWSLLDDFTASTGNHALAIPHHTIRSMFIQDWTLMNPKYVKLVEVTSVHGECLYDNELNYRGSVDLPATPIPGSSVIDALSMGYRMTFIANGDNHDGHPGHSISHTRVRVGHQYPYTLYNARNGHPYPSGITAVYATSLTRDGVFSGLESGQVYANSDYGRPILDFSINDVPVGYNSTVFVATPTTPRNLTIFIAQDGSPAAGLNQAATAGVGWVPNWGAAIEIIKNGVIWQSIQLSTPFGIITIADTDAITGTHYDGCIEGADSNYYINGNSANPVDPSSLNTGGMDYYTIRVVGANGRTSYIGPIWVSSP